MSTATRRERLTPRAVLRRVDGVALVGLLDTPGADLAAHRLLMRDDRPLDRSMPPAAVGLWLIRSGYSVSRRYTHAFGAAYRAAMVRGGPGS